MAENEKLSIGPLLDENGLLNEAGFSYSLLKKYDPSFPERKGLFPKEEDAYLLLSKEDAVVLSVAKSTKRVFFSISLLSLAKKKERSKTISFPIPEGFSLPKDSRVGDFFFEDKKKGLSFSFAHQGGKRRLICSMENFTKEGDSFRCDFTLEETNPRSIVIAAPLKEEGSFLYSQKIPSLKVNGYCKKGEKLFDFNQESHGIYSYLRGNFPKHSLSYWAYACGQQNGHLLRFNFGRGSFDESKGSENILLIDENAYKLDDVKFDIPLSKLGGDDFMAPWKFRSSKGDISLLFTPSFEQVGEEGSFLQKKKSHRLFGTFSGFILVEGEQISFADLPGFAQKSIRTR